MRKNYKSILILGLIMVASLLVFLPNEKELAIDSDHESGARQLAYYEKYKDISGEEYEAMPKRDRPDLAMLHQFEMTKDPKLGYPPSSRKLAAFSIAKEKLAAKAAQRGIQDVIWEERGPNNVGGRTRTMMFDPNDSENKRVFSAGVAGGIWINDDITDPTSTWTNVNDFMSNLAVCAMTYDPNSTQTFYAGTGETFAGDGVQGVGIFKSTDSGQTWSLLESTSDYLFTQKMAVTSESTVLAATFGGLKRSTDGGETWESPDGVQAGIADLEIAANGDIYLGNFQGLVLKSTDDGVTWESISPADGGQRVEVGVAPSNSDVVYAMSATGGTVAWITRSDDAGATWTDLTIPPYREQSGCALSTTDDFTRGQAGYDLVFGVSPTDPLVVMIGGIDILRSTNGGTEWDLISYWTGECDVLVHADQHAMVFRPGNPNEAIFGNDGGVYYSADVGDADADPDFVAMNTDYNVTQFYSIALAGDAASNYMLAGAQDNGTQRFRNPGVNATDEPTGGDGAFCFIDQDNFDIQITSFIRNAYRLSLDGGGAFTAFGLGQNTGGFINPSDYDSDADILYARSVSDEIVRYSDLEAGAGDLTTDRIALDLAGATPTALLASPNTSNRVFLGTNDGSLYRMDNAHETPELVGLGAPENGNVSSIEVGPSDDDILVTYANYGVTSVWYSPDGGSTWENKEGDLPDMPVYWAMFSPKGTNEVLLATEVGVWSVDDFIDSDSPEWEPTNEGLANVSCQMLQYRESDDQIAVTTHGRGVYTTYSFSETVASTFELNTDVAFIGEEIETTNNSIGNITDILWDFGDGITSTDQNPKHTYGAPGEFTISLSLNGGTVASRKKVNIIANKNAVYATDFEANQSDFLVRNITGSRWELGNSTIAGKDGTTSGDFAWVTGVADALYGNGTLTYLNTPQFDFSAAGTYNLSFSAKYQLEVDDDGAWDAFWVEYTTDQGSTWTRLGTEVEDGWYDESVNTSADVLTPGDPVFGGVSDGFETKTKDVSTFAGTEAVAFRIVFQSDNSAQDVGIAVDDFEITGPESNATADFLSSFAASELCAGESITFFNNSSGSITDYSWNFGEGASPATATSEGPHDVTYTAIGSKNVSLTVTGSLNGMVTEIKADLFSVIEGLSVSNTFSAGDMAVCQASSTNIIVASADDGILYQLINADTNDPIGSPSVGDGSDLMLSTGDLETTTNFFVEASNSTSGCSLALEGTVTVTVEGPFVRAFVVDQTDVCQGEAVSVTITNAETGMSYQLVNQETGDEVGDPLEGADADLMISSGALTDTLFIAVKATNISLNCGRTFDASVKVNVVPLPVATITQADNLDLETEDGFDDYQWYLNGEALSGRSKLRTYTPASKGDYTVEVTKDGCTALSAPFAVTVTGLEDELERELSVYPNPSRGLFTIAHDQLQSVRIYQLSGQLIHTQQVDLQETTIDLSAQTNGIYIMELTIADLKITRKIAIQN